MGASYRLDFGTGITDVTVKQTSIDNPIGFSNSVGTLILSDNLYQKMRDSTIDRISVISINGEKCALMKLPTQLWKRLCRTTFIWQAHGKEKVPLSAMQVPLFANLFYYDYFLDCYGQYSLLSKYFVRNLWQTGLWIMLKMGYSHTMIKNVCVGRYRFITVFPMS